MKMHERSLFAVLLRNPWWVSLLVGAGSVVLARIFLPLHFALFAGTPFFVIAIYAGWKELREPSAERVAAALERARGMSWDEFSGALEAAYRRQGYDVARAKGAADLELGRNGRTTVLVAAKRWKAARTGVEPLRELEAYWRTQEAGECVYVAAGEVTEQAVKLAAEKRIRLLHGAELAKLLKP